MDELFRHWAAALALIVEALSAVFIAIGDGGLLIRDQRTWLGSVVVCQQNPDSAGKRNRH